MESRDFIRISAFRHTIGPLPAFLQARFLTSAAKPQDFPPEAGPELAFAGRSNVGKSSAINALAGRKRLAFFSKTPGRTQTINFYDLGDRARLADLPGYGYATAPKSLRASWDGLIGGYLAGRRSLGAVVVLMDARHPLTANDRHFLEWLRPVQASRLVLLSKSDKLSRQEAQKTLHEVRAELLKYAGNFTAQLFSSSKKQGMEEAEEIIGNWLGIKRESSKKSPRLKGI